MAGLTVKVANIYPEYTIHEPDVQRSHKIVIAAPIAVEWADPLAPAVEFLAVGPLAIEHDVKAPAIRTSHRGLPAVVAITASILEPKIVRDFDVRPAAIALAYTLNGGVTRGPYTVTPAVMASEITLVDPGLKLDWDIRPAALAYAASIIEPVFIWSPSGHIWYRDLGQIVFDNIGEFVEEPMYIREIVISATADGAYKIIIDDRYPIQGTITAQQRFIVIPFNKRVSKLRIANKPAGTITINLR